MAIGSLLLRPQSLELATVSQEDQALADVWELIRLIKETDPSWLNILFEELRDLIIEIVDSAEASLLLLQDRLTSKIYALIQPFQELFEQSPAAGIVDVSQILSVGSSIFEMIATVLDALNTDTILGFFGELLEIIETDLGLGAERLKSLLQGLIANIVQRLQADVLNGNTSAVALQLYQLGKHIDKFRQSTEAFNSLPTLDKAYLLGILSPLVEGINLSEQLAPISQRIRDFSQILNPLATLSGSLNVDISVGAATQPRVRSIVSEMMADADNSSQKTCWYASWLHNEPIKDSDPLARLDNDRIGFKLMSKEFMEGFAFHSRWIAKALELVFHGLSIPFDTRNGFSTAGQPYRSWLSNTLNMGWQLADMLMILIGEINLHRGWQWLVKPILSYLGSLAQPNIGGRWYRDTYLFWINLLKIGETTLYARWTFILREGFLSVFTLLNFDNTKYETYVKNGSDALKKIHNHNQGYGLYYFLEEIAAMIFVAAANGKEDYGWANGEVDFGVSGDNGWTIGKLLLFSLLVGPGTLSGNRHSVRCCLDGQSQISRCRRMAGCYLQAEDALSGSP